MNALSHSSEICFVNRSSFSEARDKLHWEAFAYLLDEVRLEDQGLPRWKGHRVRAVDGTFIQLPKSAEIEATFTTRKGGFGDTYYPYAKLFAAANIFTGQITHARVGNNYSQENDLLAEFIAQFQSGDVAILDRGMGGRPVWARFDQAQQHFLSRLTVRRRNFFDHAKKDQTLCLKFEGHPLNVRVIRGPRLRTGQYVYLATNLLDAKRYSRRELLDLYLQRQSVEDVFLNLKTKLHVKNIRSKKINGVLQEIFAALTMTSLIAGLRFIFEEGQRRRRVSFKALTRRLSIVFGKLLRPPKQLRRLFADMINFGHTRQPDRSFPRFSRQPANKWIIERMKKSYRARSRKKEA